MKLPIRLGEEISCPEPAHICLLRTEAVRVFKKGDVVRFTPAGLQEMCLMMHMAAYEIVKSAEEFAQKAGVKHTWKVADDPLSAGRVKPR